MDRFGDCGVRPDGGIPASGNFASVRTLYDGWLDVERSGMHAMDAYVTESLLSFQGGWVETRRFSWSRPLQSIYSTTSRCFLLNMSLTGCKTRGTARNLRAMHRHDAEPTGRLYMIPPEQTVEVSSLEGRSRSIRCVLDAALFDSFPTDLPDWSVDGSAIQAAFHIGGSQIEWSLRRIYREMREPDFATPQMVESLAKQLTAEIIRALGVHHGSDHRAGGLAPWRLRLIRQRLWAEEPLPSVDELAALCDMTARHLGRAFRGETGQTIGRYIDATMVERANRMLGAGVSVSAVATSLGYSTSRSFAAAFRRTTGLLPKDVRAE